VQKKAKITLSELQKALKSKDKSVRYNAMFDFVHSEVAADAIPTLHSALDDPHLGVARYAAVGLGKLGPATLSFGKPVLDTPQVIWDLIGAASRVDPITRMPQAYPDCVEALVKIAPKEEMLVGLIHDYIGLTNWYPLKASLQALATIGTSEALDLLKRAVAFWRPELDKKQKRIVHEIVSGKR